MEQTSHQHSKQSIPILRGSTPQSRQTPLNLCRKHIQFKVISGVTWASMPEILRPIISSLHNQDLCVWRLVTFTCLGLLSTFLNPFQWQLFFAICYIAQPPQYCHTSLHQLVILLIITNCKQNKIRSPHLSSSSKSLHFKSLCWCHLYTNPSL